ncbi:DUF3159 domain-containing protein [Isoptericola cucumis]|uniref:DUF3159 domain-containing protein n=1 Tax=Isoptericola cucumis TaxID=1776856 RepID=A0ABQ2BD85_9MICO|nr:DUF3159 domain-containing protein [Isoptericola cucumis]GGI11357.1 hypothetical protein GCM10007368_35800 [Isoptericola cucumis]
MSRPAGDAPGRSGQGVRAVTAESFSLGAAVGGVRGVVEAVLPGLLFVVVFVVTSDLTWSLVASVGAALVALAVRLAQRTPVTQALGGLLGIGVGVFWAWRSGEAQNFYAWGLWTNAIYLAVILVSLVARWPLVGLVVEALRTGFAEQAGRPASASTEQGSTEPGTTEPGTTEPGTTGDDAGPSPFAGLVAWRRDPDLVRRYTLATWFWAGLFGIRLAVKVPLYFAGDIGWLGTAHLVLGVPLWGLVLWLTWAVVRGAHDGAPASPDEPADDGAAGARPALEATDPDR